MAILALAGTTVIIPGVVSHFMTGGATGVIGNGAGGRRGAVLGSFVNGLAITFLPYLLLPVLGSLGKGAATYSGPDFGVAGLFLGYLDKAGGQIAMIVGIIVVLVLVYVVSYFMNKRKKAKAAA